MSATYLKLLVDDAELGEAYSRAFWALVRGDFVGDTVRIGEVVVHPKSGTVAIHLPDEEFRLSAAGDPGPIVDLLAGAADDLTKRGIRMQLETLCRHRETIRVVDVIPESFHPLIITRDQMITDGWFFDGGAL
jgi:hypothetical protein